VAAPIIKDVLKFVPSGRYGRGSDRTYMVRGTAGKYNVRKDIKQSEWKKHITNASD